MDKTAACRRKLWAGQGESGMMKADAQREIDGIVEELHVVGERNVAKTVRFSG